MFAPDGKTLWATCETNGDVFAIEVATSKVRGHFTVPPRPRNLAFLPNGSRGFVPSESSGQLTEFDPATSKPIKTVRLQPGARPMGMAVDPRGKKLYLSTGRAGTVLVVDVEALETINTIQVGKRPWGLAISPDGRRFYVANGPWNDVSVVDLETEKEVGRMKAGEGPWGVTVVAAESSSAQALK